MNEQRLKVAYVPISKGSWIDDRIRGALSESKAALKALDIDLCAPDHVVIDEFDAAALARDYRAAGADLCVLHFLSFGPGAIVPAVANELDGPVVLWSTPEPPFDGGRLKANSFCAANMSGYILTKLQRKYFWVHGWPDQIAADLDRIIKVVACRERLRRTHIGVLGGRVPGFYTSNYDELEIRRRFGTEAVLLDLAELLHEANRADTAEVAARAATMRAQAGCGGALSEGDLLKAAALAIGHEALAAKYHLDAFALRCWPELGDLYGIAPCATMGHLGSSGLYVACEGDLQGAMAMLIARDLGGGLSFFADLIHIDSDDNVGIAWHCGAACPDLACGPDVVRLSPHSVVDGGDKKGATWDFPVQGGPKTLFQLTSATGELALWYAEGEGLDRVIPVRGTPLPIRFDQPLRPLAERIIELGLQHHYAVAPDRIGQHLKMFAKLLDLPIL